MPLKDLLTIITLGAGLIFLLVILILTNRGLLKFETWPRIVGIAGGAYLFVALMIVDIFSRPRPVSELLGATVTNVILSLALGITAYFSVRKIVRGKPK